MSSTRLGPPSILLVTNDTWRWDYIGVSGENKVQTPVLDRLAREGLYIRQAQTACPLTTPAHATILTGLVPLRHGVRTNLQFRLAAGVETLPQRLKAAGYSTHAIVSGAPLRSVYGLDRGFDTYDDEGLAKDRDETLTPSSRRGNLTTDRALALLAAVVRAAPVFLWVHYYDCHAPYDPPEPFKARHAQDLYGGEVAFVDEQIGRLLKGLPAGRPWTIIVVGDHGEGLGDHGERTHGMTLYESTLQVPLILYPRPEGWPVPARPVGLVDVAPTVADLAGIPWPKTDGSSLQQNPPEGRWLASETAYPTMAYRINPVFALRKGDRIWFKHGAEEAYDLALDPGQARDIVRVLPAEFRRGARKAFSGFFGDDPLQAILSPTLAMERQLIDSLKGLGYIDAGVPKAQEVMRVDIRQFMPDCTRFNDDRRLLGQEKYREALEGILGFVKHYPNASLAHQALGSAYVGLQRYDEAEKAYRKALSLDNTDAVAALDLGNIRLLKKDYKGALAFYRQSLTAEEAQPEGHLNIALLYKDHFNEPVQAVRHLQRFIELAPGDPEAPAIKALLEKMQAALHR